jgi:hypothetical protein
MMKNPSNSPGFASEVASENLNPLFFQTGLPDSSSLRLLGDLSIGHEFR